MSRPWAPSEQYIELGDLDAIASDLTQRHIQTLVDDNAQWQPLISDDLLWELVYAPAIGHPARLSGRDEVVRRQTSFH